MHPFTGNKTGVEKSIPTFVRQRELMTLLPFSTSILWRKVKNGTFVQPVKLSDRIIGWDRSQVLGLGAKSLDPPAMSAFAPLRAWLGHPSR